MGVFARAQNSGMVYPPDQFQHLARGPVHFTRRATPHPGDLRLSLACVAGTSLIWTDILALIGERGGNLDRSLKWRVCRFQAPTRYELVVNVKTPQALGLARSHQPSSPAPTR